MAGIAIDTPNRKYMFYLIVIVMVGLQSCGIDVPSDKQEYIGYWEHESESLFVELTITSDGKISYVNRARLHLLKTGNVFRHPFGLTNGQANQQVAK